MELPHHRVRIDKWLWAVRLFKSRSLAADACNAGHVKIGGATVKPSREVHAGEVINVRAADVNRTVRVVAALEKRVGARLVPEYMEDLTPPEEFARARAAAAEKRTRPPDATPRPTKKQRRDWERHFGTDS